MSLNEVKVDVGVWDWEREVWKVAFYPPDLPEEWRVAYYANEYSCAGLPAEAWSVQRLATWAEDLPETFSLWLEFGREHLEDPELPRAVAAMGSRLSGGWLQPGIDAACLDRQWERLIPAPWSEHIPESTAPVGLYCVGERLDLRLAREVFKTFSCAPGPSRRQLLFGATPEQLAQLRVLGELMGL